MRFLLALLLLLPPLPAQAQNFGNIKPHTVLGNPDGTASKPAVPVPWGDVTGTISPMDFGAVGDGHADDTAAVQAAMNAAAGSVLYLGKHVYAINSTGITCNNMVRVVGTEAGQSGDVSIATNFSGFVPLATNQTVIKIAVGCFGSAFEDFYVGMSTPGANTSGWAFQTTAPIGNLRFSRLQIVGACGGIDISGYWWSIDQVAIVGATGSACTGIRVGHLTTGSANTGRISETNVFSVNTAGRLGVGMLIEDCGGCHFSQNDIVYPNRGTVLNPGANQEINWTFMHDTVLGDTTADLAFLIDTAAASAAVRGLQCNGCWASSSQTSNGVLIANTGASPNVKGLHFLGARVYMNAGHGVSISGGTEIDFEASHICGNNKIAASNTGIAIASGVNNVRVRGGAVGGTCDAQSSTQAAGIYFVGTSTNTLVQGVDVSQGNTTPILIAGAVTGRIEGNPGYNPVGPGSITVTASPFTYTAGPVPEYVCTTGGTVSSVAIGGATMAAATNSCVMLAPQQAMVVTYSAGPTMTRSRQ
jgi:hypothetical protein